RMFIICSEHTLPSTEIKGGADGVKKIVTRGRTAIRLIVLGSTSRGACRDTQPEETPMQLNPYLTFNGQCEAAFKFYEKCLGGKIVAMFTHAGTPAAEHVPPEWQNKIMHACLKVDDNLLMG